MRVTEAIKAFLVARQSPANQDMVERWTEDDETQVNVAPGNGEPVEGKRSTWADVSGDCWWNIRIPKNADGKDGPAFWNDYELKFPFELHAEGIGSTGHNFKLLRSRWVAFDFDSITTHAKGVGVTDEELEKIKVAASAIPWVETRKSTGGSGIHLYVYLDLLDLVIANHTEHAALARCILGIMSSIAQFDFASQIDACGGVMWQWHRKMTAENEGLKILKPAERKFTVADLPANWRDHIEVIQKKRTKVRVSGVGDDQEAAFDALASSRKVIPLDPSHKAQIEELMRSGFTTLWISDQHLLQTHSCSLTWLMEEPRKTELKLVGCYKSSSDGKDKGSPNCFLFPLVNGAWKVYRFSQGTTEADTWQQDGRGWTSCNFNILPTLAEAVAAAGGVADGSKVARYVFDTNNFDDPAEAVLGVLGSMGTSLEFTENMRDQREICLSIAKDGGLLVEVERRDDDAKAPGWIIKKSSGKRSSWQRTLGVRTRADRSLELGSSEWDHKLREIMSTTKEPAGWAVCKGGVWYREVAANVKMLLQSTGMDKSDAEVVMGEAIDKSWNLVNLPFHPEYPGATVEHGCGPTQVRGRRPGRRRMPAPSPLGQNLEPYRSNADRAIAGIGMAQEAGIRTALNTCCAGSPTSSASPLNGSPTYFSSARRIAGSPSSTRPSPNLSPRAVSRPTVRFPTAMISMASWQTASWPSWRKRTFPRQRVPWRKSRIGSRRGISPSEKCAPISMNRRTRRIGCSARTSGRIARSFRATHGSR